MEPSGSMYDEASTIFSPDGRLFQVEYAREAVKKGATTIGVKFKSGVLLLAQRPELSHLVPATSLEKIYRIDDHIICTVTGLVADGRHLIELAREEAQLNRIRYEEPIPVKILVDTICEYEHLFTQFDGVRPFGVVLLVAGVDASGVHLFTTDPSGAYLEYKAICEGTKSQTAMTHFSSNYESNQTLGDALSLSVTALQKSSKKKLLPDMIDAAVIDSKTGFHLVSAEMKKKAFGK
jgi:proteasome alpha subunit